MISPFQFASSTAYGSGRVEQLNVSGGVEVERLDPNASTSFGVEMYPKASSSCPRKQAA